MTGISSAACIDQQRFPVISLKGPLGDSGHMAVVCNRSKHRNVVAPVGQLPWHPQVLLPEVPHSKIYAHSHMIKTMNSISSFGLVRKCFKTSCGTSI